MSPQAHFSIECPLKLSHIHSLKHPHTPLQQNASLLQYAVLHRAPEAGQLHCDTPLQSTWHAPTHFHTHHDEYPHKLFCKCFLLLNLSLSPNTHTRQQIQFDIMFTLMAYICSHLLKYLQCQTHINKHIFTIHSETRPQMSMIHFDELHTWNCGDAAVSDHTWANVSVSTSWGSPDEVKQ